MILSAVKLAKSIIRETVVPGDIVVDGTVGNGADTVFLADLVGDDGLVYGFDIQRAALDSARGKLQKHGFQDRVKLICDGHQNMDIYVDKPIRAVMFNLGYLPGGDHSIVTRPDTTLKAVEKSIMLLVPGGIVTIVAYCGHRGGMGEKDLLLNYIASLNPSFFRCISIEAVNQKNNPPILMVIEKKSSGYYC